MRIEFSSATNEPDIRKLLRQEVEAGRIAPHVYVEIRAIKARSGKPAYNVYLSATERDRGRRAGNSGSYGSMNDGSYAATYDEWGWLLAALYNADPDMHVGSPSYPTYRDDSDFHDQTGWTYRNDLAQIIEQWGDPYPFRSGRNLSGRRGFGRQLDAKYGAKEDERTAEWARKFYAGEVY